MIILPILSWENVLLELGGGHGEESETAMGQTLIPRKRKILARRRAN